MYKTAVKRDYAGFYRLRQLQQKMKFRTCNSNLSRMRANNSMTKQDLKLLSLPLSFFRRRTKRFRRFLRVEQRVQAGQLLLVRHGRWGGSAVARFGWRVKTKKYYKKNRTIKLPLINIHRSLLTHKKKKNKKKLKNTFYSHCRNKNRLMT